MKDVICFCSLIRAYWYFPRLPPHLVRRYLDPKHLPKIQKTFSAGFRETRVCWCLQHPLCFDSTLQDLQRIPVFGDLLQGKGHLSCEKQLLVSFIDIRTLYRTYTLKVPFGLYIP